MLIGSSPRRKEDLRFLTGRARYLDDVSLPGLAYLVPVRSPHAHARILKVDGSRARAMDGVLAVLTRQDLPELAGMVPPLVPAPDAQRYHHPALAGDVARHAGEAVAVVVAIDPARAADGADQVVVEYEPLPSVCSPADAEVPAAPRVHAGWPDNVFARNRAAKGDVARGLAEAELTVSGRFSYPRVGGMPIEPRGVVA